MSWHGETNPHFRPPPNQDQHSQPLPQIQDQHSLPPRGPRFTEPQPQGQGQVPHSQPPTSPWFTQPPIHDHQHAQVPRAKKPKHQDRRYRPLGPWSMLPEDQPPQGQQSRRPQGEHSGPQVTQPMTSTQKQTPQQPQPHGTHSDPQATQPKHQQPHSPETAIPPPHQDHRPQPQVLRVPSPRRTKLRTWILAAFCAIFWIVIILGGLIVLIVYLLFRPHNPRFDVSSVTLNAAYLDVGVLLNADLTLLANFTNPNNKVKVDFSYVVLDLYYGKTLIASQYVEPFSAARATSWFTYVHMLTSQVRLPSAETQRLKKEIDTNAVVFQVKGVFRARSNLGSFLRYSYWLYSHCTLVISGPPSGVMRAGKCKTKR